MNTKPCDLRLRDVVCLSSAAADLAPYMTATVYNIDKDYVYMWRPYVSTSDFSTTSGVIPTIGIETVKVWVSDTRPLQLLERRATR